MVDLLLLLLVYEMFDINAEEDLGNENLFYGGVYILLEKHDHWRCGLMGSR